MTKIDKVKNSSEDDLDSLSSFLEMQVESLQCLKNRIDHSFLAAACAVSQCGGKVIFTGVGKSGHVGKLLASTYCSLGISSICLNSNEALHGDLGVLDRADLLVAISNSGQTKDVIKVINFAKLKNIKTVGVLGNRSPMSELVDVFLDASVNAEAGYLDCIPMSSLTITLVIGQSIASTATRLKGFSISDFSQLHPAGNLGRNTNGRE